MAALKDLKQRLDDAQRDLDEVVADFDKVIELRSSLQAADASLRASSDTVATMAASLKQSALGLTECISSLKTAANVISSIDPNELREVHANIERRMASVEQDAEKTRSLFEERIANVKKATENSGALLEKQIIGVEHATQKTGKLVEGVSKREWIVLVLVVAALAVSIANFLLANGQRDLAYDIAPPSHVALRPTLAGGDVAVPQSHSTLETRGPGSSSEFGLSRASEAAAWIASVPTEQRGYGTRRKGENS